jgi:hypothetical protein
MDGTIVSSALKGWADSDWAGDRISRKSVDCIVAEAFGNVLSISTKGQACVAQSSGEAELGALHRCALKMVGIQNLVYEVWGTSCPITLCTDSSAAKVMAVRRGSGKVRHLEVKQLYIQSLTTSGRIRIEKLDGKRNKADCGTKPHGSGEYSKFREMLQIVDITSAKVKQEIHSPSGEISRNALATALVSALIGPASSMNPEEIIDNQSWSWTASTIMTLMVGLATLLYLVWISTRRNMLPPEDEGDRAPTLTHVFVDDEYFHTDIRCAQLQENSAASRSFMIRQRCLCCWVPANSYEERRLAELQQAQRDRLEYEQHQVDGNIPEDGGTTASYLEDMRLWDIDDADSGYVRDENGNHLGYYEDMRGTLPESEHEEEQHSPTSPGQYNDDIRRSCEAFNESTVDYIGTMREHELLQDDVEMAPAGGTASSSSAP